MHHVKRHRLTHAIAVTISGFGISLYTMGVQAGPTIEFGKQGSLNISYAFQGWLQNRDFTSTTDDGDSTDAFLRRNRLTFSGQFNDSIGFYAQLEAGNDSKFGQDDRNVYYRDAYVTLDYSDALRFIVGRFKNTFSRENLEACLEPLTMDRAELLSYTPFAGSRDTGVAVWGNLLNARLQYRVMIADGREGNEVVEDSPRITGRLHYSFLDPEPEYGYRGTYLGTAKVLTVGAAYDTQANVAYSDYPLRAGAQDYKASTLDLFFEYPTASGVYTLSGAGFKYDTGEAINGNPDPALPVTSDMEGYYVKAGYMLPRKLGPGRLQFFARHEKLDFDVLTGTTSYFDRTWDSLGAHYYIDGQRLKVSFEYAKIDFVNENPANPALQDYSQATLGLQMIF